MEQIWEIHESSFLSSWKSLCRQISWKRKERALKHKRENFLCPRTLPSSPSIHNSHNSFTHGLYSAQRWEMVQRYLLDDRVAVIAPRKNPYDSIWWSIWLRNLDRWKLYRWQPVGTLRNIYSSQEGLIKRWSKQSTSSSRLVSQFIGVTPRSRHDSKAVKLSSRWMKPHNPECWSFLNNMQ